jgi:hypothetical protein
MGEYGRFVEGADRSQLTLLPDCLEDWVSEDNAVNVIDTFVEALDLHGMGSAQDAKVSVDMIGIGGMSCAHWRSTKEHLLEGTVWIYGFWTGLNYVAAASGLSPAKINMSAKVVEVEKTCAQQTSQTLASAVWTTYLGSKK